MTVTDLQRQLEHTKKEHDAALQWYEDAKRYVYRTEGALTMVESLLVREEAKAVDAEAAVAAETPDDDPDDDPTDPNPTIH